MSKRKAVQTKTITTLAIVAALTAITTASLGALLSPQEAYAPTSRRGFFCEYREVAMTEPWMPFTQQVVAMVENNALGNVLI